MTALPRADWRDQEPYASERGKTCPARYIDDQGRVWRYVGGLLDPSGPIYREEETHEQ